jgi:hypothetical protein
MKTYTIGANGAIAGFVFTAKKRAIAFADELNRIAGFPVIVICEQTRRTVYTVK